MEVLVLVQLALCVLLLESGGGRGGCRRSKHMDGALLWEVTALRRRRKTHMDMLVHSRNTQHSFTAQ